MQCLLLSSVKPSCSKLGTLTSHLPQVPSDDELSPAVLHYSADGSITNYPPRPSSRVDYYNLPPIPPPNFDDESFDVTLPPLPRLHAPSDVRLLPFPIYPIVSLKAMLMGPPPLPRLRSTNNWSNIESRQPGLNQPRPQLSTPLRQYHRRSITQNPEMAADSSFVFRRGDINGPPRSVWGS